MTLHIFGIRHHGPGSARSLLRALEQLQPDALLVEGPPDAADVLPLLIHAEMGPPVALLVYVPDQPQAAAFYPFAVFSPEWQALRYGLKQGIAVRFMDLPQAHRLALQARPAPEEEQPETAAPAVPAADPAPAESAPAADAAPADAAPPDAAPLPEIRQDPLGWLAAAAGYSDGERWWDHMVEQRRDGADLFAAILEAMAALREEAGPDEDPLELQREAYMRQVIRQAQSEGFERIAIVCGAWHAPALATMPPAKTESTLLKGLPRVKTQATWVPWTYGRLTYTSGYGAGIESPGWYHHLWNTQDQVVERWLTRVARLLRGEDLDASSAHVIEAVRLADALAALRDRPLPGLPELNEAVRTVLCFGSDVPMSLIQERLIVSETLGTVPEETPLVPLQRDLQREQKRLKLPPEKTYDVKKPLDLDLRKETDLARSHLLHRLTLLGIRWGELRVGGGRGKKGTWHEVWHVQWQPELSIQLIEAGIWGNTVYDAATAFVRSAADKANDLPTLTSLIDRALLADLPDAVEHLMNRVQTEAAIASDIAHLIAALPPLVNVLRYGSVRKTDTEALTHVVDGLVARICVGLPGACAALNDDAAAERFRQLMHGNDALTLLQDAEHLAAWQRVLQHIADLPNIHGLIVGRCCRLLLDASTYSADEVARRMGLALSTASDPPQAAAWLDGFLQGSGLVLLHDDVLWQVLDSWLTGISGPTFTALLPLLRRTFSSFDPPERRKMGERARQGAGAGSLRPSTTANGDDVAINPERAARVLPLLGQLLGLDAAEKGVTQ